jgi:hypothetical protein
MPWIIEGRGEIKKEEKMRIKTKIKIGKKGK